MIGLCRIDHLRFRRLHFSVSLWRSMIAILVSRSPIGCCSPFHWRSSACCYAGSGYRFIGLALGNSHYSDVIMGTIAYQITSLTIVYSTVYSGTDQRKHQSSASLAFVRGIHRRPVNSPHKGPVTRKMSPFDDVIMWSLQSRYMNGKATEINGNPTVQDYSD